MGLIVGWLIRASPGWSSDITEQFSVGGVLAGIVQYQSLSGTSGYENLIRGLIPFQPQFSFTPTKNDQLFAKLGFAAGNGLMEGGASPFVLAPWGGDTEDGVKDVYGRNRGYLLTAWFMHTFDFFDNNSLSLTGGIIDATDYIDTNAYANDEYNQFLNQAFVNGPNSFVPSYDIGGVVQWDFHGFSAIGVGMAVGSNGEEGDLDEPYSFCGLQLGYNLKTGLGKGNYRVMVDSTSKDFSAAEENKRKSLRSITLSFDQEFGDILGAWIRLCWQDKGSVITWGDLYSGGLYISGKLWDRSQDNIGIGFGHLRAGTEDLDYTDVFEIYGRFCLNDIFAITGDIQYMKDEMYEGDSPSGWIFGLRATAEF